MAVADLFQFDLLAPDARVSHADTNSDCCFLRFVLGVEVPPASLAAGIIFKLVEGAVRSGNCPHLDVNDCEVRVFSFRVLKLPLQVPVDTCNPMQMVDLRATGALRYLVETKSWTAEQRRLRGL